MGYTSAGLTNGGKTAHYEFVYDSDLAGSGGPEPARTNQVIASCEADFDLISSWFGPLQFGAATFPAEVKVRTKSGGAAWGKTLGKVHVKLDGGSGTGAQNSGMLRYFLVAEIVEVFGQAQDRGWYGTFNEGSAGEALSRFLSIQFYINIAKLGTTTPPTFGISNSWMTSARADWVNRVDLFDHEPDAITGCETLFLWYLSDQLGFSIPQIVAAGGDTLADVYRALTKDTGDPFPTFKHLMDVFYPQNPPTTTGAINDRANADNPFPVGLLSFWVDKSTFGRDEVTDVIASSTNGTFPNAFWVVLEGMNQLNLAVREIKSPVIYGRFATLHGLQITVNPDLLDFEDPSNALIPQRIRFPYDVRFSSPTLNYFPPPGVDPVFLDLGAGIYLTSKTTFDATAGTEFELVSGSDPYFTNIDPGQNNKYWLSQDLRVFSVTPGIDPGPIPGVLPMTTGDFNDAYLYMRTLLEYLNIPQNHFTDGTIDPLTSGVIPGQSTALSAYTSVSGFVKRGNQNFRTHNFAVARVRLRGSEGKAGEAAHVKVFFRVWATATPDAGFDPYGAYRSHLKNGHPAWPEPASDLSTIPFFATGNSPDFTAHFDLEYGDQGGANNRTITIQSGDTAYAYFGCFLNFFDPDNKVSGSPVQSILTGTHHCLVAEIAYDDTPIETANGVVPTPENSDKLAQRNLNVTASDNPGPADTHRVPLTFDLKPGKPVSPDTGSLLEYPDELMIDWGQTPQGAVAHIYWPQLKATKVLNLADQIYSTRLLSASDAHTVDCAAAPGGVSYVPIPPGTTENIAGLFTVDLPTTVVAGQEYDIVVRRVATRRLDQAVANPAAGAEGEDEEENGGVMLEAITPRPAPPATDSGGHSEIRNWRQVLSTFQVKIPVTTPEEMLPADQDALAVMKWRFGQMAPSNRWYPVLQRYIEYVTARVKGLGGDPDSIPASPDGVPTTGQPAGGANAPAITGRVVEVVYDCFGRFEGFVLAECCGNRKFATRDCGMADVVLRAVKDCLLVKVYLRPDREECILAISIVPC